MKDKNLQICQQVTIGGSFAAALFHFVCCGLPAISAILSGTVGLKFKQHFLTHQQMGYMLIVSGLLLVVSFYFSGKKNCCVSVGKGLKLGKAVLYFSLILYAAAVYFHFQPAGMDMALEISCH